MTTSTGWIQNRFLAVVVLLSLVCMACASETSSSRNGETDTIDDEQTATSQTVETPQTDAEKVDDAVDEQLDATDPPATSELSDRIVDLGPANGIPEMPEAGPSPVAIKIDRIGLENTVVRAVGVEPNGEMEIPEALEVGWYQYGPTPGQQGSAVLAGHIASGGINGAFLDLDRLEPGDLVEVVFDDGTSTQFEVTKAEQYEKYSLPFDDVFAETGDPQLVLITCGGEFDSEARSYEDNVVVFATPVAA